MPVDSHSRQLSSLAVRMLILESVFMLVVINLMKLSLLCLTESLNSIMVMANKLAISQTWTTPSFSALHSLLKMPL